MNLRYKYKKLLVWLSNKTPKHPPLTEREYLTKRVIIRLLANPKTHYLMTPSGRYYLQTEDKKYNIPTQFLQYLHLL